MLERRRRRRRWLLAGIAVGVALAASLVVNAKVIEADDPCRAPRAAPPDETALMPNGLSFERIGTVTHVRKDDREVFVEAVTTKPLDEVTVLIQDAVTAAGYRPAGMDSENVEAEVFFTTGVYAAGRARVRPAACPGRWDIDLVLLDRAAVPSPTTAATTVP